MCIFIYIERGISKSVCLSIYLLLTREKAAPYTALATAFKAEKEVFLHPSAPSLGAGGWEMRDGLAASAHPPWSHSCEEGLSHREHREKKSPLSPPHARRRRRARPGGAGSVLGGSGERFGFALRPLSCRGIWISAAGSIQKANKYSWPSDLGDQMLLG